MNTSPKRSHTVRLSRTLALAGATVSVCLSLALLTAMAPANTAAVDVSWAPNNETDLAGYAIHYGERPRNYDVHQFVGDVTSFRVAGLQDNRRYYFAVTAVDWSGNESAYSDEVEVFLPAGSGNGQETATESVLKPLAFNYPNPFQIRAERTAIRYELSRSANVTIQILDANSAIVATLLDDQIKSAGEHTEDTWDGRNDRGGFVANGVYFCSIRADRERRVIKIAAKR